MPLAVTQTTNNNAFAGFGTQRPNLIGDPELPADERSTSRWFNTSAFAAAPQFTLGTSSRNPVRGPGYRNLDLAVLRRVPLTTGTALEMRGEVFNATNTPPFGAPNTTVGAAAFGTITSAGDPRVIQLAVKFCSKGRPGRGLRRASQGGPSEPPQGGAEAPPYMKPTNDLASRAGIVEVGGNEPAAVLAHPQSEDEAAARARALGIAIATDDVPDAVRHGVGIGRELQCAAWTGDVFGDRRAATSQRAAALHGEPILGEERRQPPAVAIAPRTFVIAQHPIQRGRQGHGFRRRVYGRASTNLPSGDRRKAGHYDEDYPR